MGEVKNILAHHRAFHAEGHTMDVRFRIKQLNLLHHAIDQFEDKILAALHQDLRKSRYEGYLTEIGIVRDEIRHVIRRLPKWSRPKRVKTPVYHWPAVSRIYPEPYGVALIIAPWNYPFQLTMAPLVAAMAAGNCAVLKPSEYAPATAEVIREIIESFYESNFISVVTGGVEKSTALLAEPFDYILFTGSPKVGKIVMKAAAENLVPVTLELGGKSPCIVAPDARLKLTAKRIVSGKFINAGQTCIAPDYLLVHRSVAEELVGHIRTYLERFYGADPKNSPDYPKIINRAHFDRLTALLDGATAVTGGETDAEALYIAPTLLSDIDWSHPAMQDEIFGPILPVLPYDNLDEAIKTVNQQTKPLALYLFSSQDAVIEKVLREIPFGGGTINDTLIHIATPYLPFGGVGTSGMGSYHGKAGFDTFTHYKSVMKRPFKFDAPFRYPPYPDNMNLIKTVLK
ncbi:MAG TPA: aldehyde dehydrogenase [Desulfosalsimonadaceae bacterium]|nr:aldehyde dehydrogenase [Desulfosalsimonadaceae bacterium]